jgi:hypothetical protein
LLLGRSAPLLMKRDGIKGSAKDAVAQRPGYRLVLGAEAMAMGRQQQQ